MVPFSIIFVGEFCVTIYNYILISYKGLSKNLLDTSDIYYNIY